MARSAVLAIRIIADSAQARRELDSTGKAVGGFSSKLGRATAPAAAVVGALGLVAKAGIDAASSLQQSTGGVQQVFGKYAGSIIKDAKAAATAVGLSQSAYQNVAVLLGSQLKNLGVPLDQVGGKTSALIRKASDLAATFGGTTQQAVEAIGSALRGETDPIERYGVSINQAAVKAYELAHGLKTSTAAQQSASKRTATLALLYKQTASASGQFARETNTAAGASEIASAKFENAKAALGQKLLPVYAKFKSILGSVANWVSKNSGLVLTLAGVIGGLAVAVLAINAGYRAYMAISRAFIVIQTLMNSTLLANPIFRIVAIVLALGAALVVAYQKSETFRAIVNAAFGAVMAVVRPFVSFFTDTIPHAFMAIVRGLHTAWDAVVGFIKKWGPTALLVLAPFIGIPLLIWRHFGKIVGWIRGVWDKVISGARGFVSDVVEAVTSIPGRLGKLAGHFLGVGKDLIGSFFSGIANAAKNVVGWAADIAHSIVNALIRGINELLDLPWSIHVHIPIPLAPDVDFGPYTLLPRIPLWGSAPMPAMQTPSLDQLVPGFTLMAAAAGWNSAPVVPSSGRSGSGDASLYAPVRIEFHGLVTDPDATARAIESVLARRGNRVTARSARFA